MKLSAVEISFLLLVAPANLVAVGGERWPTCYPGVDCESSARQQQSLKNRSDTLDKTVELSKATVWEYGNLRMLDGTTIVTNGYGLLIQVAGDLVIDGEATIRSYKSYGKASGPNSRKPDQVARIEEQCSEPGRQPNAGPPGIDGPPGADGKDAGPIRIVVIGHARGSLVIENRGTDGSDGGRAGNGGRGINGCKGQQARGTLLSCAVAGGKGGDAGDGGTGGTGGQGGRAGNGGNVAIYGPNVGSLKVRIDTSPGKPGDGGAGGGGGAAGEPGDGGDGSLFCPGGSSGRLGQPGRSGPGGKAGGPGKSGTKL
jgi:hypothetical protein